MGQQLSQNKDELLYQQVNYGNTEGIKSLCREGARLEWIDKEGKTPLIVACLNAELFDVAKTLIELGANVNAYRPGSHGGTPLHHAAKRGLERTVKLLLSHGANASLMNDECQTPLEIARVKGHRNVVRTIERHTCPFFGFLRELHGPGFLEAFASQWLTKKVWAVVVPFASRNPAKPLKLQLALYSTPQDAQPRAVIALWKAKIEEPKFHQSDPTLLIFDDHTKTRYKFASENEGDKQQLHWFYNACIGVPQVTNQSLQQTTTTPNIPATAPPNTTEEDVELAMAINASLQSALATPPLPNTTLDWGPSGSPTPPSNESTSTPDAGPSITPSAPPIPDGPVQYPVIDSSPIDLPVQSTTSKIGSTSEVKENDDGSSSSSSCIICLDAPVEGACIPCGHMAGCMSCLNEIKGKKWGCPVCRAKIQQVIRLYAV